MWSYVDILRFDKGNNVVVGLFFKVRVNILHIYICWREIVMTYLEFFITQLRITVNLEMMLDPSDFRQETVGPCD
jgi:hypothetical protein